MRRSGCTKKYQTTTKDMIYAATKQEVEAKRKAFIRKWRLKCRAVADSLEEAGDKLFTFTRFRKANGNRSALRMRALARGIQAKDQNANHAAVRRNSRHVVLGVDGVRPDHHAKGRRLAKPRRKACGSETRRRIPTHSPTASDYSFGG
jgi:hypothetical protein